MQVVTYPRSACTYWLLQIHDLTLYTACYISIAYLYMLVVTDPQYACTFWLLQIHNLHVHTCYRSMICLYVLLIIDPWPTCIMYTLVVTDPRGYVWCVPLPGEESPEHAGDTHVEASRTAQEGLLFWHVELLDVMFLINHISSYILSKSYIIWGRFYTFWHNHEHGHLSWPETTSHMSNTQTHCNLYGRKYG